MIAVAGSNPAALTSFMPSKLSTTNPSDPRFSERAFRLVESNIADFVRNYPLVTEVRHPDLTLASLANRLRNGLTGFLLHHYPSNIDPLDCAAKWQESVIRYGPNCVLIGPRDVGAAPQSTENRFLIEWENPTADVLAALSTLYADGRLQAPSRVTFTIAPDESLVIPNSFSRDFDKPNSFVIL